MDQKDRMAIQHCVSANIRKMDRAVTKIYDEAMASCHLRITQFTLLATLSATGTPLTINQLANSMVMDRTTLTRNLGPLTQQGWVRIEVGKDQRTRLVHLTPEGEETLNQALKLWKTAQQRVIQLLGEERVDRLLQDMSDAVDLVHQ